MNCLVTGFLVMPTAGVAMTRTVLSAWAIGGECESIASYAAVVPLGGLKVARATWWVAAR